jgi:F-type H+-transporting ATPase subunit b
VDFNLTLIGESIAMVVFVLFCMKYWPLVTGAIEARQQTIADGLAAAERGQADLANAKTEVDKVIAAAREQARGIIDQANSRANGIVEAARVEGETEKKRLLESAQTEIDVEVNRARDELRGQVAAIAVAGAERILAREIDSKTHSELLAKLASEL